MHAGLKSPQSIERLFIRSSLIQWPGKTAVFTFVIFNYVVGVSLGTGRKTKQMV